MGLDVWFREDVARILAAVAIARDGLTSDERTLFSGHLRRLWHEPGRGAHYPKGGLRAGRLARREAVTITMDAFGVDGFAALCRAAGKASHYATAGAGGAAGGLCSPAVILNVPVSLALRSNLW